jgi:hypothetical protein
LLAIGIVLGLGLGLGLMRWRQEGDDGSLLSRLIIVPAPDKRSLQYLKSRFRPISSIIADRKWEKTDGQVQRASWKNKEAAVRDQRMKV